MFQVLGWIVAGPIIGVIAKLIMPGRDPGGIIMTIPLGIGGALLAGSFGRAIGFYGPHQAAGYIMSILGAIAILAIYRATIGRPSSRR